MQGYHLFFGKLNMLDELAQKRRAAIDAVTALTLFDDESCLAKEVKIIIYLDEIYKIFDEDLESSMNIFFKFTFFSIIKPYMSDALMTYIINSILENLDKNENTIKLENNNVNQLNQPFFEDKESFRKRKCK